MKTIPIVCYHGSPGSLKDFSLLQEQLPKQQLIKPARSIQGGAVAGGLHTNQDYIALGYSWGAVDVIIDSASQINRVKGVILVSPYPFPRPISLLTRIVIKTPLIGKIILKIIGKSAVTKFLVRTSRPVAVPQAYKDTADFLARPETLKQALLEKNTPNNILLPSLRTLVNNNIPLAIFWGANDCVGAETDQIEPLRKVANFKLEKKLPDAGHAIVWTHPKELARFVNDFLDILGYDHE